MRALAVCAVLVLFALPLVAAEGVHMRAGGMTLGSRSGVTGMQWDDEGAVGARYWLNLTEGDGVAFVMTVCYTPDSQMLSYCERFRLAA